jgi:hypothetical protein
MVVLLKPALDGSLQLKQQDIVMKQLKLLKKLSMIPNLEAVMIIIMTKL